MFEVVRTNEGIIYQVTQTYPKNSLGIHYLCCTRRVGYLYGVGYCAYCSEPSWIECLTCTFQLGIYI